MELAIPDVEGDDSGRAVLQQAVGETAGRGAHVEAVQSGHVEPNSSSARSSFSPPRETKRGAR